MTIPPLDKTRLTLPGRQYKNTKYGTEYFTLPTKVKVEGNHRSLISSEYHMHVLDMEGHYQFLTKEMVNNGIQSTEGTYKFDPEKKKYFKESICIIM